MSYLSLTFAAFTAVLMLVYYLAPGKCREWILLLGSLGFYLCFDVRYVLFLLFTACTTYATALHLEKAGKKNGMIAGCIALNGAVWFGIKEIPWIVKSFGRIGLGITLPGGQWLVPVGISYYTLQAIGYLVDVSKGKYKPERSFRKYLLFLSWFPAIVQGPISRYDQLMPQLCGDKPYCFAQMRDSLVLILFGLVKKMVIADRMGIFVNAVFDSFEEHYGVILYLAAVGYAVQLYTDFSGCVDICRGVSGLFGVELVPNFNRPYFSCSIKEFWGNWHMSLSGWLKDYVYIPLGGNRKGTLRKYANLMITFLVSGLWHGAGFNFFLWGGMHAMYQILGQCTEGLRAGIRKIAGVEEGSLSQRIYQRLITFHLVTLAWIVFRAGGLMTGLRYIWHMVSRSDIWMLFNGSVFTYGVSRNYFGLLFIHLAVLFALEAFTKRQEDVLRGITGLHLILRWAVYLILIYDVVLFGAYGTGYDVSSFMYGGF